MDRTGGHGIVERGVAGRHLVGCDAAGRGLPGRGHVAWSVAGRDPNRETGPVAARHGVVPSLEVDDPR